MSAKPGIGKFGDPIPEGSIQKGEGRNDKWADYVVFAVYKRGNPHITELKVRPDYGGWFGPSEIWTTDKVIAAIDKERIKEKKEKKFMTIDAGQSHKNKLEKGEYLIVAPKSDNKEHARTRHLRTHRSMDDLEKLCED